MVDEGGFRAAPLAALHLRMAKSFATTHQYPCRKHFAAYETTSTNCSINKCIRLIESESHNSHPTLVCGRQVCGKPLGLLALQLPLSSERLTLPQLFGRRYFTTHEMTSINSSNTKHPYLIRPTHHRGDPTLLVDAKRTGDARFLITSLTEVADFHRTSTFSSKTLCLQRSPENLIIQLSNTYA